MKKPEIAPNAGIVAEHDPNFRLLPRLLPDALALGASLIIAFRAIRYGGVDERSMNWVTTVMAGELFSLFFLVALVEVASRRQQPPTRWVGLLTIAALLVFCPSMLMLLKWSWYAGIWVFLPFLWSLGERFRQLWTLPRASRLEKLRTRALAFDRFQTGLPSYFAMFILLIVLLFVFGDADVDFPYRLAGKVMPTFLAMFFAIMCYDQIRVHGAEFARDPRRLWAKPGHPDPTLTKIDPL